MGAPRGLACGPHRRRRPRARRRRRRHVVGYVAAQAGDDYVFVLDGKALAGSVLALPAGGRARAVAGRRHRARFEVAPGPRARARRPGPLRAARRHVLARRDVRRRRSRDCRGLRELGVTAIELMPVATFPGERNWGYDGLYIFAPHPPTAARTGSRASSTRRTREGLAVILDVVYNHVGPGTEALTAFAPYFTDRHDTFWGDAIDYAQRGVREWAIQNAELWVRDYHVDGLRLDAVHAIFDDTRAARLRRARRTRARSNRRARHLRDGARRPAADRGVGPRRAVGRQLHHELHVLLTGEQEGYYADYGTVAALAARAARRARPSGSSSARRTTTRSATAPSATGCRRTRSASRCACVLFSPCTPLLFMGEEYGEQRPFQFFTDHIDPAIAEATREGRQARVRTPSRLLRRRRPRPAGRRRRSSARSSSRASPTRSTASCSRCGRSCRASSRCDADGAAASSHAPRHGRARRSTSTRRR